MGTQDATRRPGGGVSATNSGSSNAAKDTAATNGQVPPPVEHHRLIGDDKRVPRERARPAQLRRLIEHFRPAPVRAARP